MNARMLRKAAMWSCLLLLCATGFYLSFRPAPPPEFFLQSDKVLHLVGYMLVSVLVVRLRIFPSVISAGVALLLLAVATELVQSTGYLPNRTGDLFDFIANACGILLALSYLRSE